MLPVFDLPCKTVFPAFDWLFLLRMCFLHCYCLYTDRVCCLVHDGVVNTGWCFRHRFPALRTEVPVLTYPEVWQMVPGVPCLPLTLGIATAQWGHKSESSNTERHTPTRILSRQMLLSSFYKVSKAAYTALLQNPLPSDPVEVVLRHIRTLQKLHLQTLESENGRQKHHLHQSPSTNR